MVISRDLKSLHSSAMKKLRQNLSKNIKIIYLDNSSVVVRCTISDNKIESMKYNDFIGKDYKVFNILLSDLIDKKGKVDGFSKIIYDRKIYQVQHKIINSVFDDVISLISVVYTGDLT